jgi:structural maintenance of chromosome 4
MRASVEPDTSINGRVPTRSRNTLPEVPESDAEDDNDSLPPVKKARPSVDPEDLNEAEERASESEELKPKPRGRRVASLAKRGKNTKKAGPPRRTSRSTAVHESEDGEKGSNDEARSHRTDGRSSKRANDDDAMYDSDEGSPPVTNSRQPKSTTKARKSRAAPKTRAPHVIEDSDESDDAEGMSVGPPAKEIVQNAQDVDTATASGANASGGRLEEEEDEKSLFDPPPMPAPSSLPQTIVEEPAGPKSRLVIHKMALINFKSYAGRQEIGPFHKVSVLVSLLFVVH